MLSQKKTGPVVEQIRLLVLPHAGGAAWQWQHWLGALSADCQLQVVEYPGHGRLQRQPLVEQLQLLAAGVRELLDDSDWQYTVIVGYSMGAVVAYELYLQLQQLRLSPAHLVLAASPLPWQTAFSLDLSKLSDDELLCLLMAHWPQVMQLKDNSALRASYLPLLRHDLTLLQRYRPTQMSSINCSLTLMAGRFDRAVPVENVFAWSEWAIDADCHSFGGDHFFISSHTEQVQKVLKTLIQRSCLGQRSAEVE
jgi:surfactin synthase thioesterase subunit